MSQTNTPVGTASRPDSPAAQPSGWVAPDVSGRPHRGGRYRVASLVAGGLISVLAVVLVAGGGWALWVDRMDRDASGFLSIETATNLRTDTYAIRAKLQGDGPQWLYGSTLWGTGRVRATSRNGQPIFLGIARTGDVSRYLAGAGYATIDHLDTNDVTAHAGSAPSTPPSDASVWAASTQGTGRQTLRWKPRDGDWSVVVMNADARAGVAVRGGVDAKLPWLPWVAIGLLTAAAASGLVGGWLLIRGIRKGDDHG